MGNNKVRTSLPKKLQTIKALPQWTDHVWIGFILLGRVSMGVSEGRIRYREYFLIAMFGLIFPFSGGYGNEADEPVKVIVKQGETLYSIVKRETGSEDPRLWKRVADFNSRTVSQTLEIGDIVMLPGDMVKKQVVEFAERKVTRLEGQADLANSEAVSQDRKDICMGEVCFEVAPNPLERNSLRNDALKSSAPDSSKSSVKTAPTESLSTSSDIDLSGKVVEPGDIKDKLLEPQSQAPVSSDVAIPEKKEAEAEEAVEENTSRSRVEIPENITPPESMAGEQADNSEGSDPDTFDEDNGNTSVLVGINPVWEINDSTFITDSSDNRDTDFSVDLDLEVLYSFSPYLSMYLEIEIPLADNESFLSNGDAWLNYDFSNDFYERHLTLGTLSVSEGRGWNFDDSADLLSVYLASDVWSLTLGIGTETANNFWSDLFDPQDFSNALRFVSEYSYQVNIDHSVALAITGLKSKADDESDVEASLVWLGLRSAGTLLKRGESQMKRGESQMEYWTEIGFVTGDEKTFGLPEVAEDAQATEQSLQLLDDNHVRGWGYDFGLTFISDLVGRPEFTVAIAGTSADSDINDNTDEFYRQSGIHGNSADIGSVGGVSYYGGVLLPELSNLRIASAGVGFPLLSDSYVGLIYHKYTQVKANNSLRNAALDLTLNGSSDDIGQALDLEFGYNEAQDWSVSISLGAFEAGAATEQAGLAAYYGSIDFSYDL